MTKLPAGVFAAVLTVGLFAPTLTFAQDDTADDSTDAASSTEAAPKEETFMDKLKETFKESTTPTDEETDAIGTSEDAGRDLY